ncbi:MAG TPA: hypothetical protein VFJ96_01280 [Gemmatimonadaceae bacterium]|nr:hypothetical protein [Gemmatimonadaceae bacterium]
MAGRGARVVILFCVSALSFAPARAQSSPLNGNRLAMSAGLAYSAQRDERASSLSYSGVGPFLDLAFTHHSGASLVDVDLAVSSARSTSSITSDALPFERERAAMVRVAYLHRVFGGGPHRSTWLLGASTGGELFASDHHFADPDQRIASYGLGLFSFGPAVAWELRLGRGALSTRVDVPVVGLAWRPYAEFRHLRDAERRVVTLDEMHAAHAAVEYVYPLGARVDASIIYRLSALSVHETQPYARMSQSMLARLSVRFGRTHPDVLP